MKFKHVSSEQFGAMLAKREREEAARKARMNKPVLALPVMADAFAALIVSHNADTGGRPVGLGK